jgi:hypothetical protein
MTVTATARRAGPFNGNGVTTAFPFTFKVFSASDLEITYTSAAGIASVITSGFSVVLNADQDANPGGTITYPLSGSPMASPETLVAIGDLEYEQGTDITNASRFLPQAVEDALDRAVILMQQLKEKLSRALLFSVNDTTTEVEIPQAATRAGKYLAFDALGVPTASSGTGADAGLRTDLAAFGGSLLVAFRSSGVGAVIRTIWAMLMDLPVSVKNFGAVGDGVADDTVAIQAAITIGRSVLFPGLGPYKTGPLVSTANGQVIYGESSYTQIINKAKSDVTLTVSGQFARVHSLRFSGQYAPTTSADLVPTAVKFSGHYGSVENCWMQDFGIAVHVSGGIMVAVRNNYIQVPRYAHSGIYVSAGGEHLIHKNAVFDSSGDQFDGNALIYAVNIPDITITRNYVSRGLAKGIYLYADPALFTNNYAVIQNNDIDSIWNWGIYVDGQYQLHIKDNWIAAGQREKNGTVISAGATGSVYLKNVKEFFVTGNDLYQSQGEYAGATPIAPALVSHGLWLKTCSAGIVNGNVAQYHSVGMLAEDCANVMFTGNKSGQYVGLSNQGTSQYQGYAQAGTNTNVQWVDNEVGSLNRIVDPAEYKDITTYRRPPENKVLTFTNRGGDPFETFTATGTAIAAINTAGNGNADSNNFTVEVGRYYKVTYFLTLNSGTAPDLLIKKGDGSAWDLTVSPMTAGYVEVMYKAALYGVSAQLILSTAVASNFTLNIKVEEVSF